MPWVSDKQRAWMFATHPRMAQRWAAEEKRAPSPFVARDYSLLLEGGLVGISDAVLRDHVQLYQKYCTELQALDSARPPAWRSPLTVAPPELHQVLETPVRSLALTIEGELAEAIAQVEGELQAKGISWRPLWYLGEPDFWTADQATSINLPWYLANPILWAVVNDQDVRYSREDVVRILRHELGHALGYAFEIWKTGYWRSTFGDFFQPYVDEYTPDPTSTDFVRGLHDMPSAANAHYAQKHPDEDWAETFAVWLDPGSRWREEYSTWPGALAKLEAVETLLVGWGSAYGPPINRRVGRTIPYTALDYTVADYLGVRSGPDPADDPRRRAPLVYDAVVLHELYFDGLARGAGLAEGETFSDAGGPAGARFAQLAAISFGSVLEWAFDFRQACRVASGWALTVVDRDQRLRNLVVEGHDRGVPAGAQVLLACDVWEHAYVGDYGATRRDGYIAAWWRNVRWATVEARIEKALPPPPAPLLPLPPLFLPVIEEPPATDPEPAI